MPNLLVVFAFSTLAAAELQRFSSWFPRYSSALDTLTHTDCSKELFIYRTKALNNATNYPELKIWEVDHHATPLINCLVENTPELYKSIMASSQVMLGLMPTILASVGPSIHETAMLLVYGKRELLAFLLILGSPAVLFDNTTNIRQLVADNMAFKDGISMDLLWRPNVFIVLLEYLIASVAIANIGELCFEIGMRYVFTVWQDAQFLPGVWIAAGVFTQLLGAVGLEISRKKPNLYNVRPFYLRFNFLEWLRKQFSTSAKTTPFEIMFQQASLIEVLVFWFTRVIAACNLIFGTLLFSSLLFISTRDALIIVLRFMASAIACRVVVRYELCTLRATENSFTELASLNHRPSSNSRQESQ